MILLRRAMPAMWKAGWRILAVWLVCLSPAFGQFYNGFYLKNGQAAGDRFGHSVAATGDMDADGKSEFIIGAPSWDTTCGNYCGADKGAAYVYSGSDGALLYVKRGQFYGTGTHHLTFGWSVAGAGDYDGDGKADFIVGQPYRYPAFPVPMIGQHAFVFSGATGGELCDLCDPISCGSRIDHFGISVAGIGDINTPSDGKSEVIVGAHIAPQLDEFSPSTGAATVFDNSCNALFSKPGASVGDSLGYSVAGAGRINGDQVPDFIIGAPGANPNGKGDAGTVYVVSGSNFATIHEINGVAAGDGFGNAVSGVGDITGDGRSEFIVGAPWHDTLGMNNVGKVYVFNGATGQPIFVIKGEAAADGFGQAVAGGGDINGDGTPDFLVGTPRSDSGQAPQYRNYYGAVYVFSGVDASLLFKKYGSAATENLGYSVSGSGDLNGDGKADFIVGKPGPVYGNGSALAFVSCSKAKGDMNGSGSYSPADIVCLQQCVYQGSSSCGCDRCYADMNCDGTLSPADIVILQNLVYYGTPPPC